LIRFGGRKLLIECGLPISKIKKYLDFDLDIDACLLSHHHADHSKAAKEVMRAGITLYCSEETAKACKLTGHRLKHVNSQFVLGKGFFVNPFPINHDTPGAQGFLITWGQDRILFATDTGSLPYRFPGMTFIMIECNHSDETLQDLEPYLVARIKKTHLSLDKCIEFLERNDLSNVREIRLIHLSSRNADGEYFKTTIQEEFGIPVII